MPVGGSAVDTFVCVFKNLSFLPSFLLPTLSWPGFYTLLAHSMMLVSLTLASYLCAHPASPARSALRSRPALCRQADPPGTEDVVASPALRAIVWPEIVQLVAASEEWMDEEQRGMLVSKIVSFCVENRCPSLDIVWRKHLQHDLVNLECKGGQRSLREAMLHYRPAVLPPNVAHMPPLPPAPLPPCPPCSAAALLLPCARAARSEVLHGHHVRHRGPKASQRVRGHE